MLTATDIDDLVTELRSLRQQLASTEAIVVGLQLKVRELENRPRVPWMGLWDPETSYPQHTFASYSGGLWVAVRDTRGERPGHSAAWRLAIPRGRPGKDCRQCQSKHSP